MSNSSAFGTWSSRSGHGRSQPPVERRTSDGEEPPYTLPHSFLNDPYLMQETQSEMRPISSSSSLIGAMGDANIPSQSRQSRSPASSNSGRVYTGNVQNHDMTWNNTHIQTNMTIAMNNSNYPAVPGHGNLSFPDMSSSSMTNISMNDYATNRNVSPESLSPHSPNYPQGYPEQFNMHPRSQISTSQGSSTMGYSGAPVPPYHNPSGASDDPASDEVRRLRRRVRELELECSRARSAMETMRGSLASASGLPTPPHSAAFQNSWRARTEARKRMFCSLNRAGNALCAWHDSRRERRAFPPRNAPPGYLNCGCTYEEALFEESLTRNRVGSYLPGEAVRMDPGLRNPLLKLLEKRYGYKDGDFEHDPLTESWAEGETPALWEQKAQAGQIVRRRPDTDRH
ncbi:hypothetical protein B0H34DRAFT_675141 [Crassisporium funariophilum]|nr:hypothetical protein B0H34DRAFT_675141 [Crassisporium funariophilum]